MPYKLSLIAPKVSLSIFELSILPMPWEKNRAPGMRNKQTNKQKTYLNLYTSICKKAQVNLEVSGIICTGHI